mgnify:CR=1 FL=1
MRTHKRILYEIILSILIFFSISFITILFQLNSPLNRQIDSTLNIGFPFVYYNQFLIDPPIPNSGWNVKNLVLDFILVWLIVVGAYTIIFKRQKNG